MKYLALTAMASINHFSTMPFYYIPPDNNCMIINTAEETARSFILRDLVTYTDYSFQVDAFTSIKELDQNVLPSSFVPRRKVVV